MNESMPPVPPNCPYFIANKGGGFTFVPNYTQHKDDWEWWPIEDGKCWTRPIIAAVAESCWRKEQGRRLKEFLIDKYRVTADNVREAQDIGDMWRLWGEE